MKHKYFAIILMFFSVVNANEEKNSCEVVANVFEIDICMEDIKEKNERLKNKFSDDELLSRERDQLAFKIRSIGIEKLLTKESYTPSLDEIHAHIAFTERSKKDRLKRNEELVREIKKLLDTYEYEEKNRIKLEKAIETFEYSLKQVERDEKWHKEFFDDIEKRMGKETVIKMKIDLMKKKQEIPFLNAKMMVGNWKLNKALFDKYGGRVIFQQFGIEPIDAYQALIEDIKIKGKLKILKPVYENIFSDQEAYNKSNSHSFIPADSFSTPYWEQEKSGDSYQDSIRHYRSIPHK